MRRSRRVILRLAAALLGAGLPLPAPARASPALELLGDTSGSGGLQPRTLARGAAAAYFNPALLCAAPEGLTLGFAALKQDVRLSLQGRPAARFDVPRGIENARDGDGDRLPSYPIPTRLLESGREGQAPGEAPLAPRPRQGAGSGRASHGYWVTGLVVQLLEQRLSLGFHALLPRGDFTRMTTFFSDEREQYASNSLHPELYGDRLQALSAAAGLGVRLGELWLGVGSTLLLRATSDARAYVTDAGNLGELTLGVDSTVRVRFAPHVGLRYALGERLRLTAAAHGEQKVALGSAFSFLLSNGFEDASSVSFVLHYLPWRFSGGAAYDLLDQPQHTLTLASTWVYSRWSAYVDRNGERPGGSYAWRDTVSPTLGLRYRVSHLTLSLDASYSPTPVPLQTGRSNYVDNDRLGAALGAELVFDLFGLHWSTGARLAAHWLISRFQRKRPTPVFANGAVVAPELVLDELPDDARLSGEPISEAIGLQTNNPGWPGFSSVGSVLAMGLYVSVGL